MFIPVNKLVNLVGIAKISSHNSLELDLPPSKTLANGRHWFAFFSHLYLPISEKIHAEVVSLPMSPLLTDEEVNYVIEKVNEWKN